MTEKFWDVLTPLVNYAIIAAVVLLLVYIIIVGVANSLGSASSDEGCSAAYARVGEC